MKSCAKRTRRHCRPCIAVVLSVAAVLFSAADARAQVNGNAMALRSSGIADGTNWTLTENGYVGTYIQLSQPTAVTFNVAAAGAASAGLAPQLTFAIANKTQSVSVTSASLTNYGYTTPTLPAGTYFVRLQLDNQTANQTPALKIGSFQALGTGVSVLNSGTSANALAAAQSYIDNFRQGTVNAKLALGPSLTVAPGTQVQVRLIQNAFTLGTAVYDPGGGNFYNTYPFLTASANSTGNGALAYKYQKFITDNFSVVEPENSGKWGASESTQGNPNMAFSDQLSNFAAARNIKFRQHNLIWHSQQPGFVSTLFTNNNVAGINSAVTNRINYYISAANTQPGVNFGKSRALGYDEIDVLNEAWHANTTNNYLSTLGAAGVANIYKQVRDAIIAKGGTPRLYVNEYNVLQNSSNPRAGGSDPYANWYRRQVEEINNAGFGKVVNGVGIQLYATQSAVSAATIQQALQNLAITGNTISMTEFGISTSASATTAANDLHDVWTMFYGNPNATTFNFWGFWLRHMLQSSFMTNYQGGALMDSDGNPTALYTNTFLPMLAADNFVLPYQIAPMNLTVGADGSIEFDGTYGTYAVTVNGKDYRFTTSADSPTIVVAVPEPAGAGILLLAGAALLRRGRRRK